MKALALRVVSGSVLAAGLGLVLLLAVTRWWIPSTIAGSIGDAGWTGRRHAWFVTRGFYPPQVNPDGAQVSWMSGRARLILADLDRAHSYRVGLRVSAPGGTVTATDVTVSVDAVPRARARAGTEPVWVVADVPSRQGAGAVVVIDVPNTVTSPSGDGRELGLMVSGVRLEAVSGRFTVSWPVLGLTALGLAAGVAGILLCGVRGVFAVGLAAVCVVVWVWLLWLDFAFLGGEAGRLLAVGLGVAGIGLVLGVTRAAVASQAGLPEWGTAAGIVLGLSAVKLACFTHPQIALTDALFQVHRAQLVHIGQYYFTSVTPSPSFEFPYAIALYVAAQPWWASFPTELDLANLLRGLALVSDALVGLACYAVVRRAWNSGSAALLAAALWPLTRAPAMALGHANLTNLFGQGLFGLAMGLVGVALARGRWSIGLALGAATVFTLAFLSHFSTLSIGLILSGAVAAALVAIGPGAVRRAGVWLAAIVLVAASVSYGVYYSHFTALYRQTFERIASGTDRASATSMVASPALKFWRWRTEDQFANDYGLPGVALGVSALLGLMRLLRRRAREPPTILFTTWGVVWAGCSALGIFSSVELRANLAATPMFVCLAAYGLAWLAGRSRAGLLAASVVGGVAAWDGVAVWLMWLGRA